MYNSLRWKSSWGKLHRPHTVTTDATRPSCYLYSYPKCMDLWAYQAPCGRTGVIITPLDLSHLSLCTSVLMQVVNQESTPVACQTFHLTPNIPLHSLIPRRLENNVSMYTLTVIVTVILVLSCNLPRSQLSSYSRISDIQIRDKTLKESNTSHNEN